MWLGFSGKIWLYRHPVDFRKQIDGLVYLIADELKKDPVSGQLFDRLLMLVILHN